VPRRVDLEDRADRRVELGVHEHDRLAVLERVERDARAELDRAGQLDEDVDVLGAREQERVVGCDGRPLAQRVLERAGRRDGLRVGEPRVAEDVGGAVGAAPVDRRDAHPRDAVRDLVAEALRHEAGADEADADRAILRLARTQRGVDEDHAARSALIRRRSSGSTSSSIAQAASFSEISATGSGHSRPSRGSS